MFTRLLASIRTNRRGATAIAAVLAIVAAAVVIVSVSGSKPHTSVATSSTTTTGASAAPAASPTTPGDQAAPTATTTAGRPGPNPAPAGSNQSPPTSSAASGSGSSSDVPTTIVGSTPGPSTPPSTAGPTFLDGTSVSFSHVVSGLNINQSALVDPNGGSIPAGTASMLDNPNLNGAPGAIAEVTQYNLAGGPSFNDPIALYYDYFGSCQSGCQGHWWIVDANENPLPTNLLSFDVGVVTGRSSSEAFSLSVPRNQAQNFYCFGNYPSDAVITPVADPYLGAQSRGPIVMPAGFVGVWNTTNNVCAFHENLAKMVVGEGFNVWFPATTDHHTTLTAGRLSSSLAPPSNTLTNQPTDEAFVVPTYNAPVYYSHAICSTFGGVGEWTFAPCGQGGLNLYVFPSGLVLNVAQIP